jgi:tetratricopeptide (TPR) repeat protein
MCLPENSDSLKRILAVSGLSLVLLITVGCAKDPMELLASGKKYLAEQKYKEAVIQFKSAINANPQLADAHYQLGLVYLRLQQPLDAAQEFTKVALLDPNNLDAQLKSGNLLLLEKKFVEAREKAELVLAREPNNITALILLGNTHAGIIGLNDSLQELRQAFESEPRLSPPFLDLSASSNFKPKVELAEELYKKAISINPDSIEAHLAFTNLLIHTERMDLAEKELEALLAKHRTSRDLSQTLAFLYVQTERIDLAERIYVGLAEMNKADLRQRVILSEFYSGTGAVDKAISVLKDAVKQDTSYSVARTRLANLYLVQKQPENALELAEDAIKRDGGDIEARIVKGRALMGLRRNFEAVQELQKVATAKPTYAFGRYYLGVAHLDSKNVEKAESELMAAITNDENFLQAYVPLAGIKLSAGQHEQAIKYARRALASPALPQARLMLARAYIGIEDFASATREIETFLQEIPDNAAGVHHLGILRQAQGNLGEAEKQFERALKINPEYVDSLAALSELFIRQGQPDKAIARVNTAIAQFPNNPLYQRIQANTYLQSGNRAKAQEAFEKSVALGPKDSYQQLELADFYVSVGNVDRAIAVLNTLATNESASLQAKKRLVELQLAKKNYDAGLQSVDEILATNGADADAAILKGRLLLAQGKTAEATQQLQKALLSNTTSTVARYYLGHAYLAANNRQGAESEWLDATKSSGSFVLPYIALAQLKLEAGDKEGAARFARQAMGAAGYHAEAQLLLAMATGDRNEFKKASQLLEEYVRKNPADGVQRQRLGVAYLGQGDLGRAEVEFESALRANPNSKDSVVGLVRIYLERNQPQQAVARLNEQMAQNPNQGLWPMLAELHIRQNDLTKAEETYKRAIALDPADVNARVALADFYLGTKRAGNAATVYEELVKANGNQGTVEVRILKGRLLLLDRKYSEAIAELQSAIKEYPNSAKLRYYLGVVYRQDKKADLAESAFSEAVGIDPRFSYAHLGLAQLKLVASAPDQAIRHADDALKLDPRMADAMLVKGNAHLAKGNANDAVSVLQKLVELVPENTIALERFGTAYAAIRDFAKAEAKYQEALQAGPRNIDAVMGLARIYMQQRKPELALKRIQQQISQFSNEARLYEMLGEVHALQKNYSKAEESYRKAISIDPTNFTAYGLLGQLFLTQNSTDKAIREFETVLKLNPKSIQAQIVLAVIHDANSNPAKAKFHYREALKLDAQSPVAANNLAWLLAESGENLQEALILAQNASAKLPNMPNVMDTLGWVYFKSGAYASAVDVLKTCVERVPNNATYQYHLGMSYLKLGDKVRAKTYLGQAVKSEVAFLGADDARRTLATLQTP